MVLGNNWFMQPNSIQPFFRPNNATNPNMSAMPAMPMMPSYMPVYPQVSNYQNSSAVTNALKAQALAKAPEGYKELQTFKVPFLDEGKFYQLNNGQKVVIIPKKGPTTIKSYFGVGAFNEPDKLRGISHYIEHNLFNGSKNLAPNEFVKTVNDMGGKYNASTGLHGTDYYISSPLHKKDDLEKFISMHADMLINPTFPEDMLAKEKDVVISEIRMYEDDPYDAAYNKLLKNLLGVEADYQGLIAGSAENIQNLTRQDVIDYYNKWYTPDNMTTVIVGDVNPDQAIKLVSKHFNSRPASNTPAQDKYFENLKPIQQTKRVDIKNPQLDSVVLNMAFVGPKNNDVKESIATEALCTALAGYENSPLTKALKAYNTEPGMETAIISSSKEAPQVVQLSANFKPGEEEAGLKTIYSELFKISQNPITDEDLKIVKNKLKDGVMTISENSMGISNLVGQAINGHGDLNAYTQIVEAIDNLTAQDIQNIARKYIDLNKASIVVLHPESQDMNAQAKPQETDVQKTVKPLSSPDINYGMSTSIRPNRITEQDKDSKIIDPKNVKEYDLANNLRLVINNDPSTIKTNTVVQLKMPEIPETKAGVAEILGLMLNKGTKKHSEEELNSILDVNNLEINAGTTENSILVSTDNEGKDMAKALDIVKELIYDANLTEENFNKAKEEIKIKCSSVPLDPSDRATEALFGEHPYGHTPRKILEKIDQVTLQDIKDFYNKVITNSQGIATITGPVDKTPNLENTIFSSLQTGINPSLKTKFVDIYQGKELEKPKVIAEAKDRTQAHIVKMFKIEESGNVKDQAALKLLNEVLGGNSQSRLFSDLREAKKLAYRVKSYYLTNGAAGQVKLEIKTTTKENGQVNDNLKKSIDGFNEHINKLISTPVSKEELEAAKLTLKSAIIFDAESSAGKTTVLLGGFNSPYGSSHITEMLKTIDQITPEDVQKSALLFLNKPSVTSVVASPDTIEKNQDYLKQLGEFTYHKE